MELDIAKDLFWNGVLVGLCFSGVIAYGWYAVKNWRQTGGY